MFRSKTLIALCLGFVVAGCSDTTGPVVDEGPDMGRRWGRSSGHDDSKKTSSTSTEESGFSFDLGINFETATIPTDGSGGEGTGGINPFDTPDNVLEQGMDAPQLESYATSFTHVQGKTTIFSLNYEVPNSWYKPAFLFLEIPPDAQVLNEQGVPIGEGESVQITVEIDMKKFLVHFGPHGSTFLGSRPAKLWFKYDHAELAGRVEDLTMWYQAQVGDEWVALETTLDTFGPWAWAEIDHFSNYAVAW